MLAQSKGSFIGIKGGLSIPVGEYASTNLDNGCFTQLGFNVNAEGAWFFKNYLGIGGQFGFNLHPVNVGVLGWEKVQDDPFLQDLIIRSEPYQIITANIGFYSKWNFWKLMSLHGKLLGGMMWAKTPYQLYKPEYFLVGPEYFEITSSRDWNLMGLGGIGLQFDLSPCIALRLEGEYQFSKMIFGFTTASGIRYEYRNISFVNTTLGLIILLGS